MTETKTKSTRGFAGMSKDARRAIASKGGKAAHAQGRAHQFDRDEATHAGRLGGLKVSRDREYMAAIGRKGGQARGRSIAAQAAYDAGEALADKASL